ncbi:MAG TPA: YggT family protein [Acidimicrobiales bacterium]|jgi:YggT family protein|nr:YggT family protein [Acidimicrobiales bacterium]
MIIIHDLITIYIWILIIAALLSWFPTQNSQGGLAATKRVLARLTEPVLRPLRAILPRPSFGGVGIDLSVLIAVIGLEVINVII